MLTAASALASEPPQVLPRASRAPVSLVPPPYVLPRPSRASPFLPRPSRPPGSPHASPSSLSPSCPLPGAEASRGLPHPPASRRGCPNLLHSSPPILSTHHEDICFQPQAHCTSWCDVLVAQPVTPGPPFPVHILRLPPHRSRSQSILPSRSPLLWTSTPHRLTTFTCQKTG